MNPPVLSKEAAWPAVVAEAATWIALLHGPERTPAVEQGFKQWLAENPLHVKAFELATETWGEARASVKRSARVKLILPGEKGASGRGTWRGRSIAAAAVVAIVAVGVLASLVLYLQQGVGTEIGERRILTLDDGTQVYLNTATKIVVGYNKHQRHISLESGEALFEVAKRPAWPFVVSAGDKDITAVGTAFLVRRDDDERVAVTLVEGKVLVGERELVPGERITYTRAAPKPEVDRPALDKLTAWQNGKINLDDMTLAEAIAEMNRYSTLQLEVDGTAASTLRLSGIFRIGDSMNFANAVARTHGLDLTQQGRRVVLSGTPRPASE